MKSTLLANGTRIALRHRAQCRAFGNASQKRSLKCGASSAQQSAHNANQSKTFDSKVNEFQRELPSEILDRLVRIAASCPLSPSSRVIDVGSVKAAVTNLLDRSAWGNPAATLQNGLGTGCLIPHLQAAGCSDILAVDLSNGMLTALREQYGASSTLGNATGVRTWLGDICELPNHQGRADAVFMNSVFGNIESPRSALLKSCTLLNPGGHIVISHPLGRRWHQGLHEEQPEMVPHPLPDAAALREMVHDLPLEIASFADEQDFYCAVLRIPAGFAFQGAPLRLKGPVVTGFQRGSKQMGVPTANIDPAPLEAALRGLPNGVYFGWAKLCEPSRDSDGQVYKMVMNVGVRPTIKDGSHVTVEAHILHSYADDFYGKELRVVAVGFIRPEMKMTSLDMLINRIHADIGIASSQLDLDLHTQHKTDSFFE